MATPYQDAAASQQGTPYSYTPAPAGTSSQMNTPDPSQYASTSAVSQVPAQPTQYSQTSQYSTPPQYSQAPQYSQPAQYSQPVQSQAQTQQQPTAGPSRQAGEDARKDKTLAEFLLMLDDYEPLVRVHRAPYNQ
jgi:hypothetical protein